MTTKLILDDYKKVLERLTTQGPTEELLFEHQCLSEAMEHFRLRLDYEQARIAYAIHREFADSEPPLTEEEVECLNEAANVNHEISELLRGRKGGRAKKVAS